MGIFLKPIPNTSIWNTYRSSDVMSKQNLLSIESDILLTQEDTVIFS